MVGAGRPAASGAERLKDLRADGIRHPPESSGIGTGTPHTSASVVAVAGVDVGSEAAEVEGDVAGSMRPVDDRERARCAAAQMSSTGRTRAVDEVTWLTKTARVPGGSTRPPPPGHVRRGLRPRRPTPSRARRTREPSSAPRRPGRARPTGSRSRAPRSRCGRARRPRPARRGRPRDARAPR